MDPSSAGGRSPRGSAEVRARAKENKTLQSVAARQRLVESHLPLVVKIAMQYRNLSVPLEDLVNEGNIGLLEAAKRFEPDRGVKFVTYAMWWVKKSILMALTDHGRSVRITPHALQRIRKIEKKRHELEKKLGRPPSSEEIARALNLSLKLVDQAALFQIGQKHVSILDAETGQELPLAVLAGSRDTPDALRIIIEKEDCALVRALLKELDERERFVIDRRFGIPEGRTMTLKEVGRELGLSREHARTIQNRALGRLGKLYRKK